MKNLFDVMLCIVILIIYSLVIKIWSSLDKFLEKKAENLATKQDVTEITEKTEKVQAEFHKILGRYDADLEFKYQFYESQYKELYSDLYCKICESEALRYILDKLTETHLFFCDVPIVEYVIENDEVENSIIGEITSLIRSKHIYASPELIKIMCMLDNIQKYEKSTYTEESVAQIQCKLKVAMTKTILKDYYWLRQQLLLQESEDEIRNLQNGKFISI